MHNHQPAGYVCPFCRLLRGDETGHNRVTDIVRQTNGATAFIAPRWWPNNRGHVLVVPNEHQENLYDLSPAAGHAVHDLVREVAIAIRATYGCDGTSTRQHNEPAGSQDVWHHHVHVFPRYVGDELYGTRPLPGFVSPEERLPYAERLRHHLATVDERRAWDSNP